MSFNQGCKGLVPNKELMVEYLFYFLVISKKLLNDLGTGTTFKEISGKKLSSVKMLLPPLAEQQHIVAKLDAAFAEIENANNAIIKSKANYLALKSAILAQELQSEVA
jgi:Restriction endonuclease S subunits